MGPSAAAAACSAACAATAPPTATAADWMRSWDQCCPIHEPAFLSNLNCQRARRNLGNVRKPCVSIWFLDLNPTCNKPPCWFEHPTWFEPPLGLTPPPLPGALGSPEEPGQHCAGPGFVTTSPTVGQDSAHPKHLKPYAFYPGTI